MFRKMFFVLLLTLTVSTIAFAEEVEVKGVVKKIAEDGSTMVIDNTTLMTNKEFIDKFYVEEGDRVIVTADKTDKGLTVVNLSYVFEDNGEGEGGDEYGYTEETATPEPAAEAQPVAAAPQAAEVAVAQPEVAQPVATEAGVQK